MRRKIIILCTIIGLFAGRIYAQQNVPQESQKLEKLDYIQKVEKYRKMRGAGAALTVVGSILSIAGTVTAINNMDIWVDDDNDSAYAAGTICALAGYGMLGAGIPLWIVGGVQHKKYSTKLQGLSIKVNATPQAQGLTLTYRF